MLDAVAATDCPQAARQLLGAPAEAQLRHPGAREDRAGRRPEAATELVADQQHQVIAPRIESEAVRSPGQPEGPRGWILALEVGEGALPGAGGHLIDVREHLADGD